MTSTLNKGEAAHAGRPTLAELQRRKRKVVEVATALFVRQGYGATSLIDIARGANVGTRTLHQHFGDKESIFREVIRLGTAEEVIAPPKLGAKDDLLAVLNTAAQYIYDVVLGSSLARVLRLLAAEIDRFPTLVSTVSGEVFRALRCTLTDFFQEAAEYNHIPRFDFVRAAKVYVNLMIGTMMTVSYYGQQNCRPPQADITEAIEFFTSGFFGIERP